MKATGIVRRIDDLGRVVIPKEIRRTLRVREGTPLEIFTDREGEIILKKYFPFIEVIVITQNEIAPGYETSSKYDPKSKMTPEEYYGKELPVLLEQCVRNIFEVRKITAELQKNTSWEKVMVEKIVNSVNGQGKFDEFTKKDIDDVIKMFQELQIKVEE